MRRILVAVAVMVLLSPLAGHAQDGRGGRANVSRALGADSLKSLQFSAAGQSFAQGQSAVAGAPWPAFNVTTFTRQINYETTPLRGAPVRSRAEIPPRGGGTPVMGELRQVLVVSGDYAWNVTGEAAASGPIALIERQLQLWPPRTVSSGRRWPTMPPSAGRRSPSRPPAGSWQGGPSMTR